MQRKAIQWWNSLPSEKCREIIYQVWESQDCPEPIKKVKKQNSGLVVEGWGEGQKMLRAFPGGFVVFCLYDQLGHKAGVEGVASQDTSRGDLIESVKSAFFDLYKEEMPKGYRLAYQEIYG